MQKDRAAVSGPVPAPAQARWSRCRHRARRRAFTDPRTACFCARRSLLGLDRETATQALNLFVVGKTHSANQLEFVKILQHIGVDPEAPRITTARGPPLWDECAAQEVVEDVDGVEAELDWDLAKQSPPDYPDDQCTDW